MSAKYEYDNNGNLERKTDPRNILTTLAYDALNRNTSVNYSNTTIGNPDVPDIQRFYDRPTAGAFGNGRFWYSYAGGDEAVGSNVEKTAIETYDAVGRPKSLRQYFKFNRTRTPSPYQTEREYDLAGNVASQTYPSGHSVDYSYDTAGHCSRAKVDRVQLRFRTEALRLRRWGLEISSMDQRAARGTSSTTRRAKQLLYQLRD